MNIPPSGSVIWIFARQLIMVGMLLLFALFAFQNKMAVADIVMIMTTSLTVFGFDVIKHRATKPDSTTPEVEDESSNIYK